MSNSLDPDQARRFVGPDLGLNCLPKLSADVTGRQGVNRVEIVNHLTVGDFFKLFNGILSGKYRFKMSFNMRIKIYAIFSHFSCLSLVECYSELIY